MTTIARTNADERRVSREDGAHFPSNLEVTPRLQVGRRWNFLAAGEAMQVERFRQSRRCRFAAGDYGELTMHSLRPTFSRDQQSKVLRRGSCLLLLYLFTATPLAPVMFSLLAEVDRSHHVAIQQTSQGLQVVLRHDRSGSASHRHGMVARALTVFAQRTAGAQSDHVIQFGATDTARQAPALMAESAPELPVSDADVACQFLTHELDRAFQDAAIPKPPPAAQGLLLTIRSVVLRI